MRTHLLFVYGTLLQKDNAFGVYLKKHCQYITQGAIIGRLYDIGDYPGLLLNSNGYPVHGSVYSTDSEELLNALDTYEGVGPYEEQPNLYLRMKCTILTDGGEVNAWVYIYNLTVEGLPEIISGNYLEYSGQKNPPVVKPEDLKEL